MRVLLLGGSGQLGRALQATAPAGLELMAPASGELDIAGPGLESGLAALRPAVVINAAAYTAVDRAEAEPDRAMVVNADAVGRLAHWCAGGAARLLHVSTDYVFGGESARPRAPADAPAPLSVYGASKLAGELQWQAAGVEGVIVRTSWLYSRTGHNFVKTMLRLMGERDHVAVVADQFGAPTSADGLARVLWRLAQDARQQGIFHWSDAGSASWYDFAVAIQEEALTLGLLAHPVPVKPLRTRDYPLPARRPAFSLLDSSATHEALVLEPVHWREQLRQMLRDYQQNGES